MATRKTSEADVNAAQLVAITKSVEGLHQALHETGLKQASINTKLASLDEDCDKLQVTMSGEQGVLTRLAVVENQIKTIEAEKSREKGRWDSTISGWSAVIATLALIVSIASRENCGGFTTQAQSPPRPPMGSQ